MKLSSTEMERLQQDMDLTPTERINQMNVAELKRFISMQDSDIGSQQRQFDEYYASLPTEHQQLVALAVLKERIYQVTLHTIQNHRIFTLLNTPKVIQNSTTETATEQVRGKQDYALAA